LTAAGVATMSSLSTFTSLRYRGAEAA